MIKSDQLASELVARCFAARNRAHTLHLQTESYAEHKALEFFYTEIVDKADEFAETYQGSTGRRLAIKCEDVEGKPIVMVSALRSWIMRNRADIGLEIDTHIQNQIDEIVTVLDRTRYLLTLS